MLFTHSIQYVILFHRSGLIVYKSTGEVVGDFPYPLDSVKHLSITNNDLLVDFITQSFPKKTFFHKEVLFVLGNDILFVKEAPLDIKQKEKLESEFIDKLPFVATDLEVKVLSKGNQFVYLAAAKSIYRLILHHLNSLECKVSGIVPLYIYHPDENLDALTQPVVHELISKKNLIKTTSFELEN